MKNRLFGLFLAIILCASLLTACGGKKQETAQEPSPEAEERKEAAVEAEEVSAQTEETTSETASEDGQNPVMNFVGAYTCERCDIFVECQGEKEAKFLITWGSSAWEHSEWTMSGEFDEETMSVYYHDCERKDLVYNDKDGNLVSEETVYVGGHGTITFGEDSTVTWEDDQEHMADGMVFEWWNPQ